MSSRRIAILVVSLAVLISASAAIMAYPTSSESQSTYEVSYAASKCHYRGQLPDPVCTPGAIDQTITQQTIHQTICIPGWLNDNKPRPSTSVTNRLKYQGLVDYGVAVSLTDARTMAGRFEEDHLISRELGGSDEPSNLWPEPGASPNQKDKIENKLHDIVCADKMPLNEAQRRIKTDWTIALP